jgi:hypothetical protein
MTSRQIKWFSYFLQFLAGLQIFQTFKDEHGWDKLQFTIQHLHHDQFWEWGWTLVAFALIAALLLWTASALGRGNRVAAVLAVLWLGTDLVEHTIEMPRATAIAGPYWPWLIAILTVYGLLFALACWAAYSLCWRIPATRP